ncbi:hypothetical protein [Deinococcus yavapaiensis]|uniref:META domain-containing protein n=1 Tax=Deinococcus yavapaiensis KR-236 TaxID=694435 RepID=A0A318RZC9_9DEIO|nr:hypothetical protein [Deinococcus yavapaiensis]PYE49397.1 hypothetical protein DES52_12433 [Deinococcus yavapaiensis KR-236]
MTTNTTVRAFHLLALVTLASTSALAATVPNALRGDWTSGYVSSGLPAPVEYFDTATGKFSDASGTLRSLKINADGTYESRDLMTITTYGCTSKIFVQVEGQVRFTNDEVTFVPKTSYSAGYTCSPSKTYEKRNHVQPSTKGWRIDTSSGRPVLVLTAPDGGASRYDHR